MNLDYHELSCKSCHGWAKKNRVIEISCVGAKRLIADYVLTQENASFSKHMEGCAHCSAYYDRHLLLMLLGGMLSWVPCEGYPVRINGGVFENYTGHIVSVSMGECLITVHTSIFGRETDVKVSPSHLEPYAESQT
jgi:hypothetical protein